MNGPMSIIQRHHEAISICHHIMLHAVSDLTEIMEQSITAAEGEDQELVLTWLNDDDDIVLQLSYYGVFVGDLSKRQTCQIVGLCYLHHIPVFLDDDLVEMMEKELPETTSTIN
jgi:hypothetical protein